MWEMGHTPPKINQYDPICSLWENDLITPSPPNMAHGLGDVLFFAFFDLHLRCQKRSSQTRENIVWFSSKPEKKYTEKHKPRQRKTEEEDEIMLILALIDVIAKKQGIGPGLGFSCCLDVSLDLRGGCHCVLYVCLVGFSHLLVGLACDSSSRMAEADWRRRKRRLQKCGKYKK